MADGHAGGVSPAKRGLPDNRPASPPAWRNPRVRAIFFQILALAIVIVVGAFLLNNTLANLAARGIRSGYGFLSNEAGFSIGETVLSYQPSDSYGRAILAGVLNTLRVALLGIILATIIGIVVGIARLSHNWLLRKLASIYVETVRNVPVLLQLLFWYAIITGVLPPSREALEPVPYFFLSKSGLTYPVPLADPGWTYAGIGVLIGVVGSIFYRRWALKRRDLTGAQFPIIPPMVGIVIACGALLWLAGGAPTAFDVPEFNRFTFSGGQSVTPEFLALLLGLTIYTAGFIAEIVRSGILAVPWGQTEAALAIGLKRKFVLRYVVLPQALRIIIPPVTGQYLNLTKNSSLAVAIGYPDLVSVTNTTLNQTGQAIEAISIMMAIYLTISLSISLVMNWYNHRVRLVER